MVDQTPAWPPGLCLAPQPWGCEADQSPLSSGDVMGIRWPQAGEPRVGVTKATGTLPDRESSAAGAKETEQPAHVIP